MSERKRNQRGEGGRLKEELIDAAMRLLDQSPSAPLSLRMVAREAGVAAPSIYPHFESAQALMSEIVRECWRQMGAAINVPAQAADRTPLEKLKLQMSAFVDYAMARPSRYQLLFAMQPIEPEEADSLEGYLKPAYRRVRETIEEHMAAGGQVPAKGRMAATLFVICLAHGRIALAHLAPNRPGNSAKSVSKFVLDEIDRAFCREAALVP